MKKPPRLSNRIGTKAHGWVRRVSQLPTGEWVTVIIRKDGRTNPPEQILAAYLWALKPRQRRHGSPRQRPTKVWTSSTYDRAVA